MIDDFGTFMETQGLNSARNACQLTALHDFEIFFN